MAAGPSQFDEAEFVATVDRLRAEVRQTRSYGVDGGAGPPGELRARRELDRLWAVSADRPYLYRAGRWGRLRGVLLVPLKAVLRRLLRWYVEPLATDQRSFNAAVLRLADELTFHLEELDKRLERLEQAEGDPTERRSSSAS
jgi:hypothetical protein